MVTCFETVLLVLVPEQWVHSSKLPVNISCLMPITCHSVSWSSPGQMKSRSYKYCERRKFNFQFSNFMSSLDQLIFFNHFLLYFWNYSMAFSQLFPLLMFFVFKIYITNKQYSPIRKSFTFRGDKVYRIKIKSISLRKHAQLTAHGKCTLC